MKFLLSTALLVTICSCQAPPSNYPGEYEFGADIPYGIIPEEYLFAPPGLGENGQFPPQAPSQLESNRLKLFAACGSGADGEAANSVNHFDNARLECESRGMLLLSLQSPQKLEAVRNEIIRRNPTCAGNPLWISVRYVNSNSYNSDFGPLPLFDTEFAPSIGDAYDGDECLAINLQELDSTVMECNQTIGYICEEPIENYGVCQDDAECGPSALCTNGQCQCDVGYYGDGVACADGRLKPSACDNASICSSDAVCSIQEAAAEDNSNSSIQFAVCECNSGFIGNGLECNRITVGTIIDSIFGNSSRNSLSALLIASILAATVYF